MYISEEWLIELVNMCYFEKSHFCHLCFLALCTKALGEKMIKCKPVFSQACIAFSRPYTTLACMQVV